MLYLCSIISFLTNFPFVSSSGVCLNFVLHTFKDPLGTGLETPLGRIFPILHQKLPKLAKDVNIQEDESHLN